MSRAPAVSPPPTYEWVDLPEGRQDLPAWLRCARVNWMDRYDNAPDLELLVTAEAAEWPGKRWRRHGDALYAAIHEDGRADFLSARGEPTIEWLPARLPLALPITNPQRFMGRTFHGLRRVWATPQCRGFAGRHTDIVMENGCPLVLRGAWFGSHLPGYVQTSYHVDGSPLYQGRNGKTPTKWDRMGYFGLFIHESLWLKALARFAPECRAARVTQYGHVNLQPVAGTWDEPKRWERERARAARDAAREVAQTPPVTVSNSRTSP